MRGVRKHSVEGVYENYSAIYQTPETLKLDREFGLVGLPARQREGELRNHSAFIDFVPGTVMDYFARVAAQLGHFVGLPLNEIETATNGAISKNLIQETIREGYLEMLVHDGIKVVAPTTKYSSIRHCLLV